MKTNWRGVFPAVCTFFHEDDAVDYATTAQHVERLLTAGVHGLIMLGSVGENTTLEPTEKREILTRTVKQIGGRVPVLTGVAENTPRAAARFAEDARTIGVDGVMLLPAMVYKADPRETLDHFRTVARAVDIPIMIYNNPIAYHVDLTPPLLAELADEPLFVAVKESSDNPRRITDIINLVGRRYELFSGVDDLVLESVLLGAIGWVSGLVNAFPEENRRLWDLTTAGKWDEAVRLYRWFMPMLHLDSHVKFVQYIKLATHLAGFGSDRTRAPRLPLVGEERERITKIVQQGLATRPVKP